MKKPLSFLSNGSGKNNDGYEWMDDNDKKKL